MRACVDPVRLFLFRVAGRDRSKKRWPTVIELPYCPFDIMSSTIAGAAQRSRPIYRMGPITHSPKMTSSDWRAYPVKASQRNERGCWSVQLNCANHSVLRTVLHDYLRKMLSC